MTASIVSTPLMSQGSSPILPGPPFARTEVRNHRAAARNGRQDRLLRPKGREEDPRRRADRRVPALFLPSGRIAIVTNKTWAAIKRRSALKIVWDDDPTKYTIQMFTARRWKRQLVNRERWLCSEGDANRALDGAEKKVMAEYYVLDLAQSREP